MKYLKKYNKHTQYQLDKDNNIIILPNVSKCIDNNHVHFNNIARYYFNIILETNPIITVKDNTIDSINMNKIELTNGYIKSLKCPIDYINGYNLDSTVENGEGAAWMIIPSKYFDETKFEFIDDADNRYKLIQGPKEWHNYLRVSVKPMIHITYLNIEYTLICLNDENIYGKQEFININDIN